MTAHEPATLTLADFLLARYEEEESVWRGCLGLVTRPDFSKLAESMLSDLDAKRRAIAHLCDVKWSGSYAVRDVVLADLALPYADHPDFRPKWRV